MDALQGWLSEASALVWGLPTIALLLGTGVYLTIVLRGVQLRQLGPALWLALVKRKEEGAEGDISHFQALMTALAATVGMGNIAGVATAIAAGGPGALFWMWVTALFGMATKYSEALLGVYYREVDRRGDMAGGPMYYLSRGVGGRFGRILGAAFALFAAIAAFGIGSMVQSNSVADALQSSFGVQPLATAVLISVLAAAVILGGIRSIGRVAGFFVPVMIVFYVLGGLTVLALNWTRLDDIAVHVFREAFTSTAAVGGFLGASVREAVRWGFARGIFSNESGLGTGGIAAAAAQTRKATTQALVSMTQTFIDTLVVCSFTGLAIIATGAWSTGADGAGLTQTAFRTGLPGQWGGLIVAVSLSLFAFSTMLGWAYYGEKSLEYLLGVKAVTPYRLVFVTAIFLGSLGTIDFVWLLSDILNGLMAVPNLVGLILLAGVIVTETGSYFQRVGRLGDIGSARGGSA